MASCASPRASLNLFCMSCLVLLLSLSQASLSNGSSPAGSFLYFFSLSPKPSRFSILSTASCAPSVSRRGVRPVDFLAFLKSTAASRIVSAALTALLPCRKVAAPPGTPGTAVAPISRVNPRASSAAPHYHGAAWRVHTFNFRAGALVNRNAPSS